MKKVFSLEKYKSSCRKHKISEEEIDFHVRMWASKCKGLTEDEMRERYSCTTKDEWMVEVDEDLGDV